MDNYFKELISETRDLSKTCEMLKVKIHDISIRIGNVLTYYPALIKKCEKIKNYKGRI